MLQRPLVDLSTISALLRREKNDTDQSYVWHKDRAARGSCGLHSSHPSSVRRSLTPCWADSATRHLQFAMVAPRFWKGDEMSLSIDLVVGSPRPWLADRHRDAIGLDAVLRLSSCHALLLFVIGCLPVLVISGRISLPAVLGGELFNPDSYMRLVRIEEGLRTGHIGHVVANDGSGAGTVLHWSHLLDSLLVLMAAPLEPLLGWHLALFIAAAISGPISVGLLGLALSWAAAPLADRRWLWAASLASGLTALVIAYGRLGVAHHHVLMAAALALTVGWVGRALQREPDAGWRAGVAAAVAIWLTPESMPLLLAAFGLLMITWLNQPADRKLARAIGECGIGFAVVLALAFAADPPPEILAVKIDRLSIVYVGLGTAVCVAGSIVVALARSRLSNASRRWLGIGLTSLPLLAWGALFPAVLHGPDGLMDAASAQAFLGAIREMQAVQDFSQAALYLLPGTIAVVYAAIRAIRTRSLNWGYGAVIGLACVGLGAWHIRFAMYPACLAAALLPIVLTDANRLSRTAVRPVARIATWLVFVFLPFVPTLAISDPAAAAGGRVCRVADAVSLLAPHVGAIVLSSPNDVPELLYRTKIKTVGSLYHSNVSAYLRLRAAWRSLPSSTEPEAVRETGANFILVCPGGPTLQFVDEPQGDTLWERLGAGRVPPWLEESARGAGGAPILYRVRPR